MRKLGLFHSTCQFSGEHRLLFRMLNVELPNDRSTCNLGVMCEHGMCMDKTILEAREL